MDAVPTRRAAVTDSRYDILKFLLALMIVVLHTGFYPAIFQPWVRLAVPVFFIMSSYFFFRKVYRHGDAGLALRRFATRSGLLYLFWFLLLIVPTDSYRHYFADGILDGIGLILFNIVLGGTFAASWFIPAGVIAVAITCGLRRHPVALTVGGGIIYVLCCSQSVYYNLFPTFNGWFTSVAPIWSMVNSFPAAIFWVGVGACVARGESSGGVVRTPRAILLWTLMAVAGVVALYFENKMVYAHRWVRIDDCYLSLMIAAPAIFMLVRALPVVTWSWSIWLRHASVIFYCLHATIARLMYIALKADHVRQPLSGITNFSITLSAVIIASVVILACSRVRGLSFLKYAY